MTFRRFLIIGKVQGVGFRAFVRNKAIELGVVGRVRNLADGSVEVVAKASDIELATFTGYINKGPEHSSVVGVEVKEVDLKENFDSFEITHCGDD